MKTVFIILTLFASPSLTIDLLSSSNSNSDPLIPVPDLDLAQFSGLWYELGHLPNILEKDCWCGTTNLTLNADNHLDVANSCHLESDGKLIQLAGKAFPEDPANGTVTTGAFQFEFLTTKSDYYVFEIAGYQLALVGSPNRKYCRLLARTPTIDIDTFFEWVNLAAAAGFYTTNFTRMDKDCSQY